MKRGEIYYIESTYRETGSEQRGGRPAVIVSNDKNNENSEVVEVVYMTTKPKNDLPNSCIYPERTLPFYRLMRTGKQRKREKDPGRLLRKNWNQKSELTAVDSALANLSGGSTSWIRSPQPKKRNIY